MFLFLMSFFFFHAHVCQGEEVEALPQYTIEASSRVCSHSCTTPIVEAEIDEDEGEIGCAVWCASVYEKRKCVPVMKCVLMGVLQCISIEAEGCVHYPKACGKR